jgi:hypothetical protein
MKVRLSNLTDSQRLHVDTLRENSRWGRFSAYRLFPRRNTMSQASQSTATQNQASYFNLHVDGLGYLSNIREITTANGSFLTGVINALHGSTEKPDYTRFDVTISGKEASSLIRRCQKSVDEEEKVLLGFNSAI